MPPQDLEISTWFENEVRINEPALRAYLQQKVPATVDVDDVIQESYARIVQMRTSRTIDSPRGLLFSIARNVTTDLFRKKYVSKTISLGEMEVIGDLSVAEDDHSLKDETEILQDAIRGLPKKCRTIFLLRNYQNLSYKDISSKLGISVKTVEAQLSIGIKKCRKHFEAHGSIDPAKKD